MEIKIEKAASLKEKPDQNNLGFGKYFTDHMFILDWNKEKGWHVTFSKKVLNKMKKYESQGLGDLPICVAKTQYSLSDDPTLLGKPSGFKVTISDLIPNTGAGFLVAISGDIMRMPGLPKVPAAVNMDIDEEGKIVGLF